MFSEILLFQFIQYVPLLQDYSTAKKKGRKIIDMNQLYQPQKVFSKKIMSKALNLKIGIGNKQS